MRSSLVNSFRKAHAHRAKLGGYKNKSALPWSEQDVLRMVAYLEQQIKEADGLGLLLLHRDLLIITLLWHTCSRGVNAGSWRLANILLPTGKNLPPPMEVPVLGGSLCSITQLGLCLAAHEVQHHPITNFITRVLTLDRTSKSRSPE
jgi:hypothetical protein